MRESLSGRQTLRPVGGIALALLIAAAAVAREPPSGSVSAPGVGRLQFEPPVPGSYALPPLGVAADGAVLDEEGRATRLHQLYDGKVVVLSFIYGACHDAEGCPLSLAVLNQLKMRCGADPELASATRILTLSFDPERDTPEVMRRFRALFRAEQADWRFLTTASTRELAPILEDYDQAIRAEYDEHGETTGQFSHVLRVFLIDREKRIRNVYSSSFLHADVVLNDLRTLLLEETAVAAAGSAVVRASPVDLLELAEHPPLGLPAVPVPGDNPLTRTKIDLGRKLFFDRRLSRNGTVSCAMCHVPEQGFTSHELATAVGIEGRTVRRNSPTIYNVAYARRLFHDGREDRLEQQIWGPLLAANEMGNPSVGRLLQRIEGLVDYDGLFEQAFGSRGLGMETLGMALASYQRTLVSGNSPFDRWHFGGKGGGVSEAAARGFSLFAGRARCAACHLVDRDHALFTDHQMHNTGIGYLRSMGTRGQVEVEVAPGTTVELNDEFLAAISETPPNDLGRYEITRDPADRWKYKTPSLRNVALTRPYMHDGSLGTLRDVVEFYRAGGVPNETLDPLIAPLDLNPQEVSDLVAFLEALTGDNATQLVRDAQAAPIGDPR
ncbi:MAG: SCO family protein [Deltaproteobacteria bacterium]|nr:SCO family protein [Deltaproteobacteria bacterium]